MRALLWILLLCLPAMGTAGPWPRAEGATYVFAGHEDGGDGWTGLYLERGLPRDLTFGIDAGGRAMGALANDPRRPAEGRLRAFLRMPVLSSPARREARAAAWRPWLAAVEIGFGLDLETDGDAPLRSALGVTVGRALGTRLGPGWTTLDLRATAGGGRPVRTNLAGVVGVKPRDRLTAELGIFLEHEDGTSWAVAPTVQYEVGRFGGVRLGVSVKDGGERALRLGWAREF
jgi:hypothetical protein